MTSVEHVKKGSYTKYTTLIDASAYYRYKPGYIPELMNVCVQVSKN